jgi:hypothetical protein
VAFEAGGAWHGSDGCNGQGGRWAANDHGAFLAISGAQTEIGCVHVDVGSSLITADRAGFDGPQLVLLDNSGRETGRFERG